MYQLSTSVQMEGKAELFWNILNSHWLPKKNLFLSLFLEGCGHHSTKTIIQTFPKSPNFKEEAQTPSVLLLQTTDYWRSVCSLVNYCEKKNVLGRATHIRDAAWSIFKIDCYVHWLDLFVPSIPLSLMSHIFWQLQVQTRPVLNKQQHREAMTCCPISGV